MMQKTVEKAPGLPMKLTGIAGPPNHVWNSDNNNQLTNVFIVVCRYMKILL